MTFTEKELELIWEALSVWVEGYQGFEEEFTPKEKEQFETGLNLLAGLHYHFHGFNPQGCPRCEGGLE